MTQQTWTFDAPTGVYKNHALSSALRLAAIAETKFMQFVRPEPGYGRVGLCQPLCHGQCLVPVIADYAKAIGGVGLLSSQPHQGRWHHLRTDERLPVVPGAQGQNISARSGYYSHFSLQQFFLHGRFFQGWINSCP